jgi:hypothetical protein
MDPSHIQPEVLRQMMIDVPDQGSTRVIAVVVSTAFLLIVLNLVRRGRLKEEYTPIWVALAVGIITLSVWFDLLRWITRVIGAWTPSSTLFFLGELCLLALCLNYAVRLSRLSTQVKALAQEIALLKSRPTD